MKFKGAIRMLMVLICACALMQISMSDEVHAGYVKEDILYTPDDTLSKYIEEHLPDGDKYEMIDSGNAIISYSQMAGNDKVSYVQGELAKQYGISEVKYYTYKNSMSSTASSHFFFDIHLSADAVVTDKDNIRVVTSDGFIVISTKAALYVMDKNKTWDFVSNVNVLYGSATGYVPFWGGGDVLNNGKERRIFVYVPAEPGVEWNSGKNCEVNWAQDILRLAELPTSQKKEGNSQSMAWKIILIGLILVFDVAMLVFFLKYIKKPHKEVTSQETTADPEAETVEAIDEETELMKLSGDRKQEEIDYLKSIGYFKSKSSK